MSSIEKVNTGMKSVESASDFERSITQLDTLFADKNFIKGYVDVSASEQRKEFERLLEQPAKSAKEKLKNLIDEEAARQLGDPDVAAAKKRGQEFGMAKKSVQRINYGGVDYGLNEEGTTDLLRVLAAEHPVPQSEFDQAEAKVEQAETEAEAKLIELKNSLEVVDKNRLASALGIWGNSADSKGSFGDDETGFNAGMIHYFEYRSDETKSGRFKKTGQDFTLEGFMDESERLEQIVENYETSEHVLKYTLIGDELGQERLFIITDNEECIVAFRRPGEVMKVVSVIPGSNQIKQFEKKVENEIQGVNNSERARLNELGDSRTLVKRSS